MHKPTGDKKTLWKIDIKTAEELGYPDKAIKLLKIEPDPIKRQKILTNARNGVYN